MQHCWAKNTQQCWSALIKRFLSVLFDIRRQSIVVENFYLKIAEIDIAQSTIWKVFDDVGPTMLHSFEQALMGKLQSIEERLI